MNNFNRFCYHIRNLLLLITVYNFAMNLPIPDQVIPIGCYQLPTLKALAARKVVENLDSDYKKETYKKISTCPKEVVSYLTLELARKHAAVLQTILDEEIEPMKLTSIFYPPFTNLYEVAGDIKRGVCSREHLFIPPLNKENKDIFYFQVCMSLDKSFCITHYPYKNYGLALAVWDVKTGEKLKVITYEGDKLNKSSKLYPLQISPDNKTIFATNKKYRYICGLSVIDGKKIYEYKTNCYRDIGRAYFVIAENQSLVVRRITDNSEVSRLPIFEGRIDNFTYQLDRTINKNENYMAAICSTDHKHVKVFDLNTGLEIISRSFPTPIRNMKFNVNGSVLALTLVVTGVEFWNVRQNKKMGRIAISSGSTSTFYDDDRLLFINLFAGNSWWDLNSYQPLVERKCSEDMPHKTRMKFSIEQVTEDGKIGISWSPNLIYSLYLQLAKELSFKELLALLILEDENQENKPFSQDAWNVLEATDNTVLKTIFKKRYESIPAQIELELAAQEIIPVWKLNTCYN